MLGLFFPIYGEKIFQTTNQVKSSVSPLHMVTTPPVPRLPNRADSGTNAPVACAKPRGSGCKARMNKGWLYSKWVENYVFLFFSGEFFFGTYSLHSRPPYISQFVFHDACIFAFPQQWGIVCGFRLLLYVYIYIYRKVTTHVYSRTLGGEIKMPS